MEQQMKIPAILRKNELEGEEKERFYAPLFLVGSSLMVVVCTLVNILELRSLDAFLAVLPISGFIALYGYAVYWKN